MNTSYEIVTDSSSNLQKEVVEKYNLPVLPFKYTMDGKDYKVDLFSGPLERQAFFAAMRIKVAVTTSLVNFAEYTEVFERILLEGKDILYIGMSSGISGSYANAVMAAQELMEKYPERKIRLVDTMNASFGEGLPVMMALQMRDEGDDLETAYEKTLALVPHTRGCFMVDDLMFLHRTGRVSGVKAFAGKALGLRPLLKGDETGHIVVWGKGRGRKAALETLLSDFEAHIIPGSHQTVAVAHCDAEKEAEFMAERMAKNPAVDNVIIEWYEQCTGSHLGPGAVAIFYMADHR